MCYMINMDVARKYVEYWNDGAPADWFFLEALLRDGVKNKFTERIIGEKFWEVRNY